MRFTLLAGGLAVAILSFSSTAALSDSCRDLRASHNENEIATCHLAYNDGTRTKSKTGCFLTLEEGFTWMGHESGKAAGQFYTGNCDYQGKLVRSRDFQQSQ